MKKSILIIFSCFISYSALAQKKEVLLTINNEAVYVDEFKRVYEKNLDLVEDDASKNIDNYLELFINYKLKVNEAYELKLDTLPNYIQELEGYKKQLLTPYLQDKKFIDKLVEEGYNRTVTDVKASHILVRIPKYAQPKDTLLSFEKIKKARERIMKGESFDNVAKEVSEDPSVASNFGNLGYFNAFKMVYAFEDAAYKTNIGEVSKPFKTRFGYHIIKVFDKRVSKGEFEAAHILINDKTNKGKELIDSLYSVLTNKNADFGKLAIQFSSDRISGKNGGKLEKFGTGAMVEEFEKEVYKLNEGEFSKPFLTRFGWHIVKVSKNYPVASFEELKPSIERKIKGSSRIKLSDQVVLNRLKKNYKIVENKEALHFFTNSNWRESNVEELTKVLLTINEKEIHQNKFYTFSKHRRGDVTTTLFDEFKNQEILNYFKDNLIKTNDEFKSVYLEYKEGLLLFELMQQKIWNKSSQDTLGLQDFYSRNKSNYKKELSEIKGQVINDYQKEIEDNWIQELREKSAINVRKKALKKFKKQYNQS